MLADRVVIRTRRSQGPGDTDNEGWNFQTEGVGSFGELRRDSSISPGTEVRLHLRREVTAQNVSDWYSRLADYLRAELCRIPCSFSLKSTISSAVSFQLKPGFTYDRDRLAKSICEHLGETFQTGEDTPLEMLSTKKREELEAKERYWLAAREELHRTLRWKSREGELPKKLGNFRIHLPYFDLPGGPAFAFLRPRQLNGNLNLDKVGKGYCYIPRGEVIFSWKGMRLHPGLHTRDGWSRDVLRWHPRPASTAEIDWLSAEAGTIGVSRHQMELSDGAHDALAWVGEQIVDMRRDFLASTKESVYSLLNFRVMEREPEEGVKAKWFAIETGPKTLNPTWADLKPPLISVLSLMYSFRPETEAQWNGKPIPIARCLGDQDDDDPYDGLAWHPGTVRPDRICAARRVGAPCFGF